MTIIITSGISHESNFITWSCSIMLSNICFGIMYTITIQWKHKELINKCYVKKSENCIVVARWTFIK